MNYNQPHQFYCGVDLHARSMFTHVLDKSTMVRVSPPLEEHYDMDDPEVVDGLNARAIDFHNRELDKILQPDGTDVDLNQWLEANWY